MEHKADVIVEKIIEDLKGRSGLGDAWIKIEDHIRKEIYEAWFIIVNKEL